MPLATVNKIDGSQSYKIKTYVSGPRITRSQKRAAQRNNEQHTWDHDSFLPHAVHFAWIVPLHALLAFMLYVTVDARTVPGHIWLGILSAITLLPTAVFWWHLYLNGTVNRLRGQLFVKNTRDDTRWYFLSGGHRYNNRPRDFSEWLQSQLNTDAPHFARVHVVVDEYLQATDNAHRLEKSFEMNSQPWREVRELIMSASDAAYEKILPIYQEEINAWERRKKEEDARAAVETAFRAGEEQRITRQRIEMAKEDVDNFTLGNQALPKS